MHQGVREAAMGEKCVVVVVSDEDNKHKLLLENQYVAIILDASV